MLGTFESASKASFKLMADTPNEIENAIERSNMTFFILKNFFE